MRQLHCREKQSTFSFSFSTSAKVDDGYCENNWIQLLNETVSNSEHTHTSKQRWERHIEIFFPPEWNIDLKEGVRKGLNCRGMEEWRDWFYNRHMCAELQLLHGHRKQIKIRIEIQIYLYSYLSHKSHRQLLPTNALKQTVNFIWTFCFIPLDCLYL